MRINTAPDPMRTVTRINYLKPPIDLPELTVLIANVLFFLLHSGTFVCDVFFLLGRMLVSLSNQCVKNYDLFVFCPLIRGKKKRGWV